jgi:hypothetical protein
MMLVLSKSAFLEALQKGKALKRAEAREAREAKEHPEERSWRQR